MRIENRVVLITFVVLFLAISGMVLYGFHKTGVGIKFWDEDGRDILLASIVLLQMLTLCVLAWGRPRS